MHTIGPVLHSTKVTLCEFCASGKEYPVLLIMDSYQSWIFIMHYITCALQVLKNVVSKLKNEQVNEMKE